MKVSVTEVHQNILQITQNLYTVHTSDRLSIPEQTTAYTPIDTPTDDIDTGTDSYGHAGNTDKLAVPVVPLLDVPGVAPDKVAEVLTAYLTGSSWSKIATEKSINYSRTIKPIKEAYEEYQASGVHTDVYSVHTSIDTDMDTCTSATEDMYTTVDIPA
jgi:hypothetical protein